MMHEQNETINKKININKDNQTKKFLKQHIYYLIVSVSDGLAGFSAQSYTRLWTQGVIIGTVFLLKVQSSNFTWLLAELIPGSYSPKALFSFLAGYQPGVIVRSERPPSGASRATVLQHDMTW